VVQRPVLEGEERLLKCASERGGGVFDAGQRGHRHRSLDTVVAFQPAQQLGQRLLGYAVHSSLERIDVFRLLAAIRRMWN
jgi:hypothetical protein